MMIRVADGLIKDIIDDLARHGKRIMDECLAEKDYRNQTGHLISSYGWGVYYNGKLAKFGVAPVRTRMAKGNGKRWQGREDVAGWDEILKYLDPDDGGGYKATKKTIELVIVAAMPYGQVLEQQSSGQRRKYKVVSMSYDKLMELTSRYPGASVHRIMSGKMQ